jgi:hypothetical protein
MPLTNTTVAGDADFYSYVDTVLLVARSEGDMSESKKLAFHLTDEQLKTIRPLLEQTGKLKIAGEIEGNKLNVSFLACNMAFIACNMAFSAADGVISVGPKK